MQLLFDNITASLIAGIVFVIISSMQIRATESEVAQISQKMAQDQARTLSTWVEEDLSQAGRNMGENNVGFEAPEDLKNTKWLTERFVFKYREVGPKGNLRLHKVRYNVASTGETQEIQEGGKTVDIPLYKFTRQKKVVGKTGWQTTGEPLRYVEYFDVDLLGPDLVPVKNPVQNEGKVQAIRIRFALIAPFQNPEMALSGSRTNVVLARYPISKV